MDRNDIKPGMTCIVDEAVGNTDYELAEWGGHEVMVLAVDDGEATVERDGRTAELCLAELRPCNHDWMHGSKRYEERK